MQCGSKVDVCNLKLISLSKFAHLKLGFYDIFHKNAMILDDESIVLYSSIFLLPVFSTFALIKVTILMLYKAVILLFVLNDVKHSRI